MSAMTFDTYGPVTGYSTATETVTDTNDNYYVSGASFNGSGTLTLTRSGLGNLTAGMASGDITGALGYTPEHPSFSGNYNDLTNKPSIYAEPEYLVVANYIISKWCYRCRN